MKNLEQIRAHSALVFANEVEAGTSLASGAEGGEVIKKIPPMIMANGLLATIAFSLETDKHGLKRKGHASILGAIARHLSSPDIGITRSTQDAQTLINYLSDNDSGTLRLATAEALGWLGYARRFVKKQGGDE